MREIKFRAWCPERRMMCNVVSINFIEKTMTVVYPDNHGFTDEIRAVKLMQYTGLKDKNGKEIYEGDIVNNNDFVWSIYATEAHYCMATDGKKTDNDHLFINEAQHCEVIGNIYDNPELLS